MLAMKHRILNKCPVAIVFTLIYAVSWYLSIGSVTN